MHATSNGATSRPSLRRRTDGRPIGRFSSSRLTIERVFVMMMDMNAGVCLTQLEEADIASFDAARATTALHALTVVRGKADQLEAAITRRLSELHEAGRAAPVADMLSRSSKRSRRASEQAERRSGALGETPRLVDALGKGKVGVEHAVAVATAAGRLDDEQRNALFDIDQKITAHAAVQDVKPEADVDDTAAIDHAVSSRSDAAEIPEAKHGEEAASLPK